MHVPSPPPPLPALPAGRRIYAVGDVHGRLDLLLRLIGTIMVDNMSRPPADAEIILLGDLIDRGPFSAQVVRWAMTAERDGIRVSAVKGNHEASLLAVLDGDIEWLESWLHYGGEETLRSWGVPERVVASGRARNIVAAARAAISPAERAWLAQLPLFHIIGDYVFVHAGIRPGVALADQVEHDLVWIREDFLDSATDHGAVIVHGHTITSDIVIRANRIGIDTGAYRSGRLTAVGIDGTDRWFLTT